MKAKLLYQLNLYKGHGSPYVGGNLYGSGEIVTYHSTPETELLDNDGTLLLDNDGTQLLDNV